MKINIIKYGGSIIYSKESMNELINLINEFANDKFIFIIGGGKMARELQSASENILKNSLNSDLINYGKDWLGISVSKTNAELLRREISSKIQGVHSEILLNPQIQSLPINSRIFFSGGWKPGWSTDFVAMTFAKNLKKDKMFKISDFDQVLDVKPQELDKTKQYNSLPELSWDNMIELVGSTWMPGYNAPLDPSAAILGKELSKEGFQLFIGKESELSKMLKNEDFLGSIVK